MKRKILILLLLIITPLYVFAADKDIIVKYKEISNVTKYIAKINNSSGKIIIGNDTIKIKTKSSLNGKYVVIIKTVGDAYKWISSLNGEKNYYYLGIQDNNELINTDDITSIEVNGKLINIYDLNGKLDISKNNIVNYKNSNFYFSIEEIPNDKTKDKNNVKYVDVSLIINGNGRVIINEKIYDHSQDIITDKKSKIMIFPDTNYTFYDAILNGKSIYELFLNNVYEYELTNEDKLLIDFKKNEYEEIKNETIMISGIVSKNGLPLQNVKIIFHSDEIITSTDNDGYYEIDSVSLGMHEMLIVDDDNNALGYTMFEVNKSGESDGKKSIIIEDGYDSYNVDLEINDNYDIILNNIHSNKKLGFNYYYLLLIIPIIIIFILLKREKNKNIG